MRNFVISLIFIGLLFSCSNRDNKNEEIRNIADELSNNYNHEDDYDYVENSEDEGYGILEGEYCAKITYYNPNTGRESNYTLTIEVYDNELEKINFPNGWLDDDHFGNAVFAEDGYVSFTSDRGYDYTVQIIGEAYGCFDNVPRAYQCIGLTNAGAQCKHLTDNPSGYCWQHEDQEY
jgi:hypothetical protein